VTIINHKYINTNIILEKLRIESSHFSNGLQRLKHALDEKNVPYPKMNIFGYHNADALMNITCDTLKLHERTKDRAVELINLCGGEEIASRHTVPIMVCTILFYMKEYEASTLTDLSAIKTSDILASTRDISDITIKKCTAEIHELTSRKFSV
jgi:hypothetical protein